MRVDEIFVSGGGTHNPTLMRFLAKAMNPIPVMETTEVGLDVDAKEAIAFAVMAYETAHSRPSNVPMATGAKRSVVLGKLTQNGSNNPRNGNAASTAPAAAASSSAPNGAARTGAGIATHKAKAARANSVNHRPVAPKAQAAVR
jgi:anhydro-N-acetylmuramic acid kinase